MASKGSRNESWYQKYLKDYEIVKQKYIEENERIKTSRVVLVGNSLIMNFPPEILSAEFPDAVNRGIGGDTADLILDRLDETVLSLKPSVVLLEIGGNDIREGKCLHYLEESLRSVVTKLSKALPKGKLVLLGIPPVRDRNINSVSPIVNFALYRLSGEFSNVTFVDPWPWMRQNDIPFIRPEYAFVDKIHVNQEAYKLWAKMLKPYLK
ncbi:GDSL-type esterase/lipase family protein [Leptospira perolatii]|nr:GDSL-type esterase/lipase family protein [Leptospira perolatii]